MEETNQLDNINLEANENVVTENVKIVQTDIGSHDGQNKCPKCGATDISLNVKKGMLRCNFCRHEFEAEKVVGLETDIKKLSGTVIASGAQNIIASTNDVLTFKCSSCGAEVSIDTSDSSQARCHWCRNTLSVNQQIPNGAIPDVVLPFNVTKEKAKEQIEKFVGKRKFFAHPKFRLEFNVNNIMGVYFPYMVVDANTHANFSGEGEIETRCYTVGSDDDRRTVYDADVYYIEREFDLTINGLTVESNTDRLDHNTKDKTNNIINAIMPFDIENCVKYNANYLKGYTTEKRDTNIEQLKDIVNSQLKDVARFSANDTLEQYDRGVAWEKQELDIKGEQWKAAYLPVWIYSYQHIKGNKSELHYVAVNARTEETAGSVPIHMPKLIFMSLLVELLSYFVTLKIEFGHEWILLTSGFIYFFVIYSKYRNSGARHNYENETTKEMENIREVDTYKSSLRGVSNSSMTNANNKSVEGTNLKPNMLDKVMQGNDIVKGIQNITKK